MIACRVQKEREPGDDPGDDEDWYAYAEMEYLETDSRWKQETHCCLGRVEKTNDRDYEVEERYGMPPRIFGQ